MEATCRTRSGMMVLVATAVFGMGAPVVSASPTVAQATYPKTFNIKQQFKAQSLATAQLVRKTNYAASPAGAITKAAANASNLRVPIDRAIPKSGVNASQPTDYATVKSLSITNGVRTDQGQDRTHGIRPGDLRRLRP